LAAKHDILVHNVGKFVVAQNEDENSRIDTLYSRGIQNGVELEILHEKLLPKYEPLARTHERFLWSSNTAISDSKAIEKAMRIEFEKLGGKIMLSKK